MLSWRTALSWRIACKPVRETFVPRYGHGAAAGALALGPPPPPPPQLPPLSPQPQRSQLVLRRRRCRRRRATVFATTVAAAAAAAATVAAAAAALPAAVPSRYRLNVCYYRRCRSRSKSPSSGWPTGAAGGGGGGAAATGHCRDSATARYRFRAAAFRRPHESGICFRGVSRASLGQCAKTFVPRYGHGAAAGALAIQVGPARAGVKAQRQIFPLRRRRAGPGRPRLRACGQTARRSRRR